MRRGKYLGKIPENYRDKVSKVECEKLVEMANRSKDKIKIIEILQTIADYGGRDSDLSNKVKEVLAACLKYEEQGYKIKQDAED